MNRLFLIVCSTAFVLLSSALFAADDGLISHWSFDNDSAGVLKNEVAEQFK